MLISQNYKPQSDFFFCIALSAAAVFRCLPIFGICTFERFDALGQPKKKHKNKYE